MSEALWLWSNGKVRLFRDSRAEHRGWPTRIYVGAYIGVINQRTHYLPDYASAWLVEVWLAVTPS